MRKCYLFVPVHYQKNINYASTYPKSSPDASADVLTTNFEIETALVGDSFDVEYHVTEPCRANAFYYDSMEFNDAPTTGTWTANLTYEYSMFRESGFTNKSLGVCTEYLGQEFGIRYTPGFGNTNNLYTFTGYKFGRVFQLPMYNQDVNTQLTYPKADYGDYATARTLSYITTKQYTFDGLLEADALALHNFISYIHNLKSPLKIIVVETSNSSILDVINILPNQDSIQLSKTIYNIYNFSLQGALI